MILFDGLSFYKLPEIARSLRDYHLYIQMSSISGKQEGKNKIQFFSHKTIVPS